MPCKVVAMLPRASAWFILTETAECQYIHTGVCKSQYSLIWARNCRSAVIFECSGTAQLSICGYIPVHTCILINWNFEC